MRRPDLNMLTAKAFDAINGEAIYRDISYEQMRRIVKAIVSEAVPLSSKAADFERHVERRFREQDWEDSTLDSEDKDR